MFSYIFLLFLSLVVIFHDAMTTCFSTVIDQQNFILFSVKKEGQSIRKCVLVCSELNFCLTIIITLSNASLVPCTTHTEQCNPSQPKTLPVAVNFILQMDTAYSELISLPCFSQLCDQEARKLFLVAVLQNVCKCSTFISYCLKNVQHHTLYYIITIHYITVNVKDVKNHGECRTERYSCLRHKHTGKEIFIIKKLPATHHNKCIVYNICYSALECII